MRCRSQTCKWCTKNNDNSYIPQYIVVVNTKVLIYCTFWSAKKLIRIISVLNAYRRRITKIMRIACVLKAYFSPILYSLQRLSNDFRYDMCRFSLSKSPVKPRGIPVLPRSLRFHASKQFDFFPSDDRATCNVIFEYFRPRKEDAIQIFNSPPILRRLQPLLPMHLLRRRRASPALPQAVP